VLAARFLGGGRVVVEERPVPEPRPGEVLVRVGACALCGSDRAAFRDGSPVTPGHETAGEVAAVGQGVTGVGVGARGVVYLVDYCGSCAACRHGWTNVCLARRRMYGFDAPGGLAEYQAVAAHCFLPVDPRLPADLATTLLDLFGTTAHALRRVGLAVGGTPPASLAVLGCGPVGLGALAVAGALGVPERYGVDLVDRRLAMAERLGAVPVDAGAGDPVAAVRARRPDGCDVVVEAAGRAATQRQAIELAGPGGRVAIVAHSAEPLELRTSADLIRREVSLVGAEYFPVAELAANAELVAAGRLDPTPLVTDRFPLVEVEQAYHAFWSGRTGKVVVTP
jgi:threonine 3-dehydrogenase